MHPYVVAIAVRLDVKSVREYVYNICNQSITNV